MKKFLAIASISLLTVLSSCDDGDLVFKDIDFSKETSVQKCSTVGAEKIFYKLQKDEALILVVDAENLMKDPSVHAVSVEIDGQNTSLDYRKYTDKVDSKSICNLPPPPSPSVVQSIPASPGGTVIINREIALNNNTSETNNSVSLTYQYAFYLQNINFKEGDTNIKYDKMLFGTNNYANRTLEFKFAGTDGVLKVLNECEGRTVTLSNREAVLVGLSIDELPNEETVKTINLDNERVATFRYYSRTGINLPNVCKYEGDIPGSSEANVNKLEELWTATKGQIVIETRKTNPIEGPAKLVHKVTLKGAHFIKDQYDNLSFTKDIVLGEYTTDIK